MGASMYMKYDKDRKSIIFRFTFDKEADEISTRSLCSTREGRPHYPHSSIRKSSTHSNSSSKSFFKRTTKRKKVAAVTTDSTNNNDGGNVPSHSSTPINEATEPLELQQSMTMGVVSADDTSSTQSIETLGDDDLEDDFMCISNTLQFDTQTKCLLKPPAAEVAAVAPEVTAKEEGTTTSLEQEAIDYMDGNSNQVSSSSEKTVTFASEVNSIEVPKFRDIPQLRQELWFSKEELHQMKLANLIRSWRQ